MRALGAATYEESRIYFTGGATAVLVGWRASTIDIDVTMAPEQDRIFRALARLKDELRINVELASPADFIPVPEGWEDRSPFIAHEGRLFFHHFDPYAQVLSKIERGHAQDLADVQQFIERGLVEPARALAYFGRIEPLLYRYPALDPRSFRAKVEATLGRQP
jgi:hypothetical protein